MVGYIGIIGAGIGNRTLPMYCTIAPVQLPFSLYTALLFLLFFSPCSSPTLTPSLKITVCFIRLNHGDPVNTCHMEAIKKTSLVNFQLKIK